MGALDGVGLTFEESMSGYLGIGEAEPRLGAERGRRENTPIRFDVRIRIDDLARFIDDPEHRADLTGTVTFAPLGGTFPLQDGWFNLFSVEAGTGLRQMIYDFRFTAADGATYHLRGHKDIHDDPGIDVVGDLTRLSTVVSRGRRRRRRIGGVSLRRGRARVPPPRPRRHGGLAPGGERHLLGAAPGGGHRLRLAGLRGGAGGVPARPAPHLQRPVREPGASGQPHLGRPGRHALLPGLRHPRQGLPLGRRGALLRCAPAGRRRSRRLRALRRERPRPRGARARRRAGRLPLPRAPVPPHGGLQRLVLGDAVPVRRARDLHRGARGGVHCPLLRGRLLPLPGGRQAGAEDGHLAGADPARPPALRASLGVRGHAPPRERDRGPPHSRRRERHHPPGRDRRGGRAGQLPQRPGADPALRLPLRPAAGAGERPHPDQHPHLARRARALGQGPARRLPGHRPPAGGLRGGARGPPGSHRAAPAAGGQEEAARDAAPQGGRAAARGPQRPLPHRGLPAAHRDRAGCRRSRVPCPRGGHHGPAPRGDRLREEGARCRHPRRGQARRA